MFKLLGYALIALFTTAQANEILPADKAFIPTVSVEGDTIKVDFEIKEGYYLYQNKISVSVLEGGEIGKLQFSDAKIKNDEFFGKVAIYRHEAHISAPIVHTSEVLALEIGFQGCADAGICYPPVKQTHSVIIPQNNVSKNNFLQEITQQSGEEDPVAADSAFAFNAVEGSENTLILQWKIREGYYLYANKFNFKITGADFGEINFPKGETKNDEFFGEVEIYKHGLEVQIPLQNIAGEVTLEVTYQGCWTEGVCYPPITKKHTFNMTATGEQSVEPAPVIRTPVSATPVDSTATVSTQPLAPAQELNEEDKIVKFLEDNGFFAIIALFFGIGLALSFTPCVLPMVPILSSIIVGQGDISKKRAAFLSLIFVLAMAVTYTIAGVIAGLSGENLQILLQNPYVLVSFSIVFVALAFSMFGYFEIKLPNALNTYLTKVSNKQQGGNIVGVAIMGFLSALIVGPCVAPPLAGSLIYISQTGDAFLGGAALFAMSIGMGVPLMIVGSGAGSLPKAGTWMDSVKYLFGVIMLGMAIYILDRVLDPAYILILWALLFTIAPIALGALSALGAESSPWQRIYKAFLLLLLGYGVLLMVLLARGGLESGGTLTAPLKGLGGGSSVVASVQKVEFKKVTNLTALKQELQAGGIVMLDFYADWCIYCKEYEKSVFNAPSVAPKLGEFKLLKVDITKNSDDDKQMMAEFGVVAPPAILFFKNGKELRAKRIIGELNAEEFLAHINSVQ